MMKNAIATHHRLVLPRLLLKSGEKIAHSGKHALYGNPPRWHLITPNKPAPKGAPIVGHPAAVPAKPYLMPAEQLTHIKLPDSNSNAGTFNKQLDKIAGFASTGNAAAILGMQIGVNTYGMKLAKIANFMLLNMGVHEHVVAHGQKAGEHAAVQSPTLSDHTKSAPDQVAANGDAKVDALSTTPKQYHKAKLQEMSAEHGVSMTEVNEMYDTEANQAANQSEWVKAVFLAAKEGKTLSGKTLDKLEEVAPGAVGEILHDYPDAKVPAGYQTPVAKAIEKETTDSKKKDKARIKEEHKAASATQPAESAATGKPDAEPVGAATPSLSMPAFEEGKKTTGVKDHYEKVAQKVIDHGQAGNASVLDEMKSAGLKPNAKGKVLTTWQGKTANSKKLLALHDAAVAHAKGGKPETLSKLPEGWSGSAGGMATKHGTDGGIVDKNFTGHGWFAVPNDDSKSVALKDKFFPTQQSAIDALEHANASAYGTKPLMKPNADTILSSEQKSKALAGVPLAKNGGHQSAITAQQLKNLQSIPWQKLKLPPENTNAKSHNAAIDKIEAMAFAGDTAGLQAFINAKANAKQTYTKKQALLAQTVLAALHAESSTATAPVAHHPQAAAEVQGTKEGDTKQGADGMLVLKNGHWVKVGEDTSQKDVAAPIVGKALKASEAVKVMASVKAKTAAGNKNKFKAMAVAGDLDGLMEWMSSKQAGHQIASKMVVHALINAMTSGGSPAPLPSPTKPKSTASLTGAMVMDTWEQVGEQGGSNPGGKFKAPSGQEWYCKFPKDVDTAKSEILAAKLYGLAGLSSQDAVLVTKGGKVGVASRWVDIKKAPNPDALAKVSGAQAGFAVDAWLGNWDVVGATYDNLQIGPEGKAHRVDAGGSLEYRAQGDKKPFGSKVDELDTMLDASKNHQASSVFSGMTKADMTASAAKVLAISDVSIRAFVNQYGPGDAAAKAKLAETLIARKNDIAKRFPAAAKKKKVPIFNPEAISAPPSFVNWGGKGSSGPSSKEFLNQANEAAVQSIFATAKTGSVESIQKLKAPVFDKNSGAIQGNKVVLEHPSQHVKGYAQQVVNEINYQLNPPKKFRFDGGHPLVSLGSAYPPHKGSLSSDSAQKLAKFIVLGDTGITSLKDLGLPEKLTHSSFGGTVSKKTYAAQAKAAIAKMPSTQKQAIKSYTGSGYHAMNGSLWAGNASGAAKAAGEALNTLSHDIAPGTVLSRHIHLSGGDLNALLGATGKILQEPAIMSTSIRPTSFVRNVQLKLHVGPGVKGLWVGEGSASDGGEFSVNGSEDELILPPGTRMLILNVRDGEKDADGFGGKGQQHVIEAIILPMH